ncbi:2-aminoadipate transaminase [compost metagenome]
MGEAFQRVLEKGNTALQYGLTEGYTPLRESICRRMAQKGIHVTPNEMLLTTGSQQAIDLLTRVYIDPGDVILVEKPTYLAALQVFKARGASIYSVEADEDGIDLDDLASKIAEHKPKLVYVIPTFSNPTGKAWSVERRKGLIEQCRKNNVLILEDDPYGEIQFDSEAVYPPIFSLDEHPTGSCVVYTSTFSKTVAPALRTGWVVGDPTVIQNMTRAKQAADLHSSSLDQQTLYQLLEHFDLDGHIAKIRYHYGERMKFMASLLEEHNWPGVTWKEPKGGMFFWVHLPENIRAEDLMKQAVQEGVAFVPGSSFFAENPMYNTMRLNYTHTDKETTILGMNKLGTALQTFLSKA